MRMPEATMRTKAAATRRRALLRYANYKNRLAILILAAKPRVRFTDVLPEITFIMPMPPSWSEKKCAAYDGQPHTQKPDLDNLLKAFKDSVFPEDEHIHTYAQPIRKVWGRVGEIIIRQNE